jgi:DNA-binding transcriptional LysR family regulator
MFESLRHFVLIVEHGTFTEAAKRAHLSQPALTASIHRLEQDIGAPLLSRGRRGATPTAAGAELLPRARAALAAIDDARRVVREVMELDRGEVRIGAAGTACTYLLPPLLAAFRKQHPKIRLVLREVTPDEAHAALETAEIDLAIVTARDEDELWMEDELVLVRAPETDPVGAPFVTFREGSTSRELLEKYFPEAEVVMELGSIAAVKGHVRSGIGIALISKHAARTDLRLGRLALVDDPRTPIRRPLHLVHRGLDRLPPAASALRDLFLSRRVLVSAG